MSFQPSSATNCGEGVADGASTTTTTMVTATQITNNMSTEEHLEKQKHDPLWRSRPSATVREGDYVLLVFGDGRQIFAHCCKSTKQGTPLRINKTKYPTHNLIGLPYGTVLEQQISTGCYLMPLPTSAKLIPDFPVLATSSAAASARTSGEEDNSHNIDTIDDTTNTTAVTRDNRSILDTNTAQTLDQQDLSRLRDSGTTGAEIVATIIENSSTFDQKTAYSKAKYVVRKQIKYQPRCRIVRCNGATVCEALFLKDPRKVMNLRQDTLAQILSYANVSAGSRVLVMETCMGIVTGAVAQRLGGYGRILSIFSGQQNSFTDLLAKFNLSFAENQTIKWLHSGDVFRDDAAEEKEEEEEEDLEQQDRDRLEWPCVLQPHTRNYIETEIMNNEAKRAKFLYKRSARFARKLCRHSPAEAVQWLYDKEQQSDSIVLVARYEPTETLLGLLPFLAPSCPFVVFCEFIEPLTACFQELQKRDLAINLRLSDTWMREYQILPGRTHPNMNMSQSGGFILTGIKLDPETGRNELDQDLVNEIKAQLGGRRRRNNKKRKEGKAATAEAKRAKRPRGDKK